MEQKSIDLNQTIYALCTNDPQLIPLLCELGFLDITKPGMLQSAGRFMTLTKGAAFKRILLERIVKQLAEQGFHATASPIDRPDQEVNI